MPTDPAIPPPSEADLDRLEQHHGRWLRYVDDNDSHGNGVMHRAGIALVRHYRAQAERIAELEAELGELKDSIRPTTAEGTPIVEGMTVYRVRYGTYEHDGWVEPIAVEPVVVHRVDMATPIAIGADPANVPIFEPIYATQAAAEALFKATEG